MTARRPGLDRETALRLADTEYQRVVSLFRALPPEAWSLPSGCPGWTVQQMAAHMLGMVEYAASLREQTRQLMKAMRRPGALVDGLTSLQVEEHEGLSPADITSRYAGRAPSAVKGRRSMPALLRAATIPFAQTTGGSANSTTEKWKLGYLNDVILTRDPWLHRSEICKAAGLEMELTPEHDGVLVDDIVREWGTRHGQPLSLTLTGPAGGAWELNGGGPALELDAVEYCQLLAGRGEPSGLLAVEVPF